MKITFVILSLTIAILFGFNYSLKYVAASDSSVSAGGNGSLWDSFNPQNVEIKVGESVTWSNPMIVSEPHTITFIMDQSYFPPPSSPYSISNLTELKSLLPNPNIEPIVVPGQNGTRGVIVDNARNYNPVAIDSTGNNVTNLTNNAKYSMIGTEKFVNSGWIWPEGMAPSGVLPINNFTVTFEKQGTYDYVCLVHPWMTGTIIVN
jgi:plastocyanin